MLALFCAQINLFGRFRHVFISGQQSEDRLMQQTNHLVQTVVPSARIFQHSASNIVQAEDFIQFSGQQETTARIYLRTMEFQPHLQIRTKPNIARFTCILRASMICRL